MKQLTVKKKRKVAADIEKKANLKKAKQQFVQTLSDTILELVKQDESLRNLGQNDLKLKKWARKAAKQAAKRLQQESPTPEAELTPVVEATSEDLKPVVPTQDVDTEENAA